MKFLLCWKASYAHMLSGWSALARIRHILRHNASFQVLFFEMLTNLRLADSVLPWYSRVDPKPLYEPPEAKGFWDVPVSAEHEHLAQNRVEARFIHYKEKTKVITEEKSCLRMDNQTQRDVEKTKKYGPLRWELKRKCPRCCVKQHNIIINILGGWSGEVELSTRELF